MKKSLVKLSFLGLFLLGITALQSCSAVDEPVINRPYGSEIDIYWRLVENGAQGYVAEFTLENTSAKPLDNKNWSIFFHQPKKVQTELAANGAKFTHINGDYFKFEPTDSFKVLNTGEQAIITYQSDAWAIKMQDAPNGLYIVFTDSTGKESVPEVIKNVVYAPILDEQNKMNSSDVIPVPTADFLYEQNEKVTFLEKESLVKIIPTPYIYKASEGVFTIENGAIIGFDAAFKNEASFLVDKLKADLGIDAIAKEGKEGSVILAKTEIASLNTGIDNYRLSVTKSGVVIAANDAVSVFYGVQSLRALIPAEDLATRGGKAAVQFVSIDDEARFAYRGMHLDVVRNFNSKETVLKLLDFMAFYKLNKFHFHITDDEGWRLEIPGLPELTDVGSKRGHTADELTMLNPAYGSGPFPVKETYGSGYYTKADFVEILKYAKARHIEVIPELDFPGHARAAIVAMKARQHNLMESGNTVEANEYLLHDEKDASTYRSVQYYDDNVICVCQNSTYKFLEKIVDEVVGMYKDAGLELKQVHIGGDEVPHPTKDKPNHGAWRGSAKCQSILDTHEEYEKPEELFYYFVEKFSTILAEKGILTAGWEEIALKKGQKNKEGEAIVAENEAFKEKGFVPYVWNTVWGWGGEDRAYKLANAGFKVVLSNVTNNYFDLSYNKNPQDPGYYWGGFVDTKKSWQFVPLNVYNEELTMRSGAPVDLNDFKEAVRLNKESAKNILGIQGQLWTETVKGQDMMEYYIFPKMLGLVERAWAKDPEWTSIPDAKERFLAQDKDWNQFASRLGHLELPKLTYLNGGVNYRIAAPGAVVLEGKLYVNINFPGVEFRYTSDGAEPSTSSTVYTDPIAVTGKTIKVVAFNIKGRASLTTTVTVR